MHIIAFKPLRVFWDKHPDAELALRRWFTRTEGESWSNFADVRASFPSADKVGRFVVFNIGGNKYRLIAAIHYNRGKVYVRHVLTYSEYEKGKWKTE